MYNRILEILKKGHKHIIVSGQPGIGKSHFKYYCMREAALAGTPILFESSSKIDSVFGEGLIYALSDPPTKFARLIDFPDNCEPNPFVLDESKYSVACFSPNPIRYKEMEKFQV
jgi:hypothetical protein